MLKFFLAVVNDIQILSKISTTALRYTVIRYMQANTHTTMDTTTMNTEPRSDGAELKK